MDCRDVRPSHGPIVNDNLTTRSWHERILRSASGIVVLSAGVSVTDHTVHIPKGPYTSGRWLCGRHSHRAPALHRSCRPKVDRFPLAGAWISGPAQRATRELCLLFYPAPGLGFDTSRGPRSRPDSPRERGKRTDQSSPDSVPVGCRNRCTRASARRMARNRIGSGRSPTRRQQPSPPPGSRRVRLSSDIPVLAGDNECSSRG
jgi:hypothetical protein